MTARFVQVSDATLTAIRNAHTILLAAGVQDATRELGCALAELEARPPHDRVAAEQLACAGRVAALAFPTLSPVADADELGAAKDWLVGLYEAVDPLIEAAGRELKSVIRQSFDLRQFTRQLEDVLQGNATFEIERAIEAETEDAMEAA